MEAFIGGCCPLSSSGHLPGHGKHRCSPVPAAESQGHGRRWRRTPFGRPPCAPCPPKQWPPRRGLQWAMNKVCAVQRSGRTVETFPGCSRWDADGAGSGTAQACRTPGPVQPPLPTPTAPAALSLSLSLALRRRVIINSQFAFVTGEQREAVPCLPGLPTGTSTSWSAKRTGGQHVSLRNPLFFRNPSHNAEKGKKIIVRDDLVLWN